MRGFTLVEVIVTTAIIALIAGASTYGYTAYRDAGGLDLAEGSVVEALRYARANSEQSNGDSTWGVKLSTTTVVVFKGSSYSTRTVSSDKELSLPGRVNGAGMSEVVFSKLYGQASATGTMSLSMGSSTRYIYINEKGTVSF